MSSTYLHYISDFENAYLSMINESQSKQVKKALDTIYKSVFKDDGYDQYGVDINGKFRDGKVAQWKYPDLYNIISLDELEKLLNNAMLRENRRTKNVVHHYNRMGLDSFGYDKQGFDINGKDVLGNDDSQFGTEEYTKAEQEREHAYRNLKAKAFMKKTNFLKTHEPLTQKQELAILKCYEKALHTDNPEASFLKEIRPIASRIVYDERGQFKKILDDRGMIGYILSQYKFPTKEHLLKINQADFAKTFVDHIKEQVNRTLRPQKFDNILVADLKQINKKVANNNDTIVGDKTYTNESEEYTFSITFSTLNGEEMNKQIRIGLDQAIKRVVSTIMRYSGFYLSPFRWGDTTLKFNLHVNGITHFSIEAKDLYSEARDRFEKKYSIGSYDPELIKGANEFLRKQAKARGVKLTKLPPL